MQKYDQYKSSGMAWLGDVPKHWGVIKFKRIIEKIKDGTHCTHLRVSDGYPLLSAKNVFNNGIRISDNESLISEEEYIEITSNGFPRKNDLLITCVGTIGRSCVYPFDYPISFQRSVAFLRLQKNAIPQFFKYFVESNIYQAQLFATAKMSAQSGVYLGDLINLTVCFPPLKEQTAITTFLDKRTAYIDRLIAKQQALSEKLSEKRTALITEAVCGRLLISPNPSLLKRGTDFDEENRSPNTVHAIPLFGKEGLGEIGLKDSGIQWLGKVPEHWEVVPLRYLFDFKNNQRIPLSSEERGRMSEKNYPYYGASGIIDYVENYIFDEDLLLVAEDGANLLSRSTPLAFKATGKYWVNNHAHIIKPKDGNLSFWEYVLSVYDFTPLITGSAQPKLTKDNLSSIKLANPIKEEKIKIATFLDKETAKIDRLQAKISESIARLKEYRSALITQSVTGKIKV